jgi:hypothetical protein
MYVETEAAEIRNGPIGLNDNELSVDDQQGRSGQQYA